MLSPLQRHVDAERLRLRAHFRDVVRGLEARTPRLSGGRLRERHRLTRVLAGYAKAGQFPLNAEAEARVPIFIDERGVHCAVGELMRRSGAGREARSVRRGGNQRYVRELMALPALGDFLDQAGLSAGEAAWIQPSYQGIPAPCCLCDPLRAGDQQGVFVAEVIERGERESIVRVTEAAPTLGVVEVGMELTFDEARPEGSLLVGKVDARGRAQLRYALNSDDNLSCGWERAPLETVLEAAASDREACWSHVEMSYSEWEIGRCRNRDGCETIVASPGSVAWFAVGLGAYALWRTRRRGAKREG